MKNSVLIMTFLILAVPVCAQSWIGSTKISHKDSIALIKTWAVFRKALLAKYVNKLKSMSGKRVQPDIDFDESGKRLKYAQSIGDSDEMRRFELRDFSYVTKGKYRLIAYDPCKENGNGQVAYVLWFDVGAGLHHPYSVGFIFVKINNRFKLDWLGEIP